LPDVQHLSRARRQETFLRFTYDGR
jgi:hypothetical protein